MDLSQENVTVDIVTIDSRTIQNFVTVGPPKRQSNFHKWTDNSRFFPKFLKVAGTNLFFAPSVILRSLVYLISWSTLHVPCGSFIIRQTSGTSTDNEWYSK